MSHNFGSANMAPILFAKKTYANPYNTKRGYGPGAIEAADDRLNEEVKARRQARASSKSSPTCGPEVRAELELERSKRTLAEARRRRKALEAELEDAKAIEALWEHKTELNSKHFRKMRESNKQKAEKERRRQAAFKEKERKMGAKTTGVEKNKKPAPKMTFSGFRLAKRNDE